MKNLSEKNQYPRRLIFDSYRSDMDGRPVDYEGDKLKRNFTRVEYVVNDSKEECLLFESVANPSVFKDLTILPI